MGFSKLKLWKKLLLGLAAAVALFLLAGLFLPSRVKVERSLVINGRTEGLYARVATPRRWPEWTAWTTGRFPDMKMRFEGPETGAGAILLAEGESSGDGKVTITRADPAQGVWYDLDFEHGTQLFRGAVTWAPGAGKLQAAWSLETEMGWNPFKCWAGLFLDKLMGGDMEEGLRKLKEQVEGEK